MEPEKYHNKEKRVMLSDVYFIFKRLDDIVSELGFDLNRSKFALECPPQRLSLEAKLSFFMSSYALVNCRKTAPKTAHYYVIGQLFRVESVLTHLLNCANWKILDRLKELNEEEKEPAISLINRMKNNYLESKVRAYYLRDFLKNYEKENKTGRIDRTKLSHHISDQLAKKYSIILRPSTIKDALKDLSETKQLPREVLYIIRNEIKNGMTKFTNGKLPIEELTKGKKTIEWMKETAEKYGFRSVYSMQKALAEDTNLNFGTLIRQMKITKTINTSIIATFQRWEATYTEKGDIEEYLEYRTRMTYCRFSSSQCISTLS